MKRVLISSFLFIGLSSVFVSCKDDDAKPKEPESVLIYADSHVDKIFAYNVDRERTSTLLDETDLGDYAGELNDIVYDQDKEIFYISQRTKNKILKVEDGEATAIYEDEKAGEVRALTVDTETGDIYWVNSTTKSIMKGHVDGADPTVLVNGTVRLCYDMQLEKFGNSKFLYYSEFDDEEANQGLWELELKEDAAPVKILDGAIRSFALDFDDMLVYYSIESELLYAPLEQGSVATPLLTTEFANQSIVLDKDNKRLYWNERGNGDDPDPSNVTAYISLKANTEPERKVLLENVFTLSTILITEE